MPHANARELGRTSSWLFHGYGVGGNRVSTGISLLGYNLRGLFSLSVRPEEKLYDGVCDC